MNGCSCENFQSENVSIRGELESPIFRFMPNAPTIYVYVYAYVYVYVYVYMYV